MPYHKKFMQMMMMMMSGTETDCACCVPEPLGEKKGKQGAQGESAHDRHAACIAELTARSGGAILGAYGGAS